MVDVGAVLAAAARAAEEVWRAGGGPSGAEHARAREAHRLSLLLLAVQNEISRLHASRPHGCECEPDLLLSRVPQAAPSRQPRELPPPAVPTSGALSSAKLHIAPDGRGFRRLRPAFASRAECERLRAAATLGMVSALRRGGQTTLAVVPELRERLLAAGDDGRAYASLYQLLERAAAAAAVDCAAAHELQAQARCPVCGATAADGKPVEAVDGAAEGAPAPLHHAGALLVRLLPPEGADELAPACWSLRAEHAYWEAHVDRHNVEHYDVSAVMYLSTQGEQFGGGAFAFHDMDGDVTLSPTAGDLLTFSSGAENPHSAARVSAGSRFAIACWFSRDASKGRPLPPPLPPASEPAHPLPLWSLDASIASSAACCLPSNDALRESLEIAHAAGRPLAPAVEPIATPAAWTETWAGSIAAAGRAVAPTVACGEAEAVVAEGEVEAWAEGEACGGEAEEGARERQEWRLSKLREALHARESALTQAHALVEGRRAAPADSSGFDVFD